MLAGVHEAELRLGHVGSESYEGAESADGGGLGDCDWEGCEVLDDDYGVVDSCFLLLEEASLTKICMVGSGSADEAREEMEDMEEMLLERMVAVTLMSVVVGERMACAVRLWCWLLEVSGSVAADKAG